MQEEELCVICQELVTDNAAFPCQHTLHAQCASKWFYSQLMEGHHMTCPVCRESPTNGWRVLEITSLVQFPIPVLLPVGPDTTVQTVKAHLSWVKGFPPSSIQLFTVLSLNETTKRHMILNDGSWVGSFSRIFSVVSLIEAEFYHLDLPRGPRTTHQKYTCPISNGLLLNPTLAFDGQIYEQAAIERWVQTKGDQSPRVPGRPVLPTMRIINPSFSAEVRAIQTVPRPMVTDLERELTVNVVCPRVGTRPFRVRYGDSMISIARRAMPNAQRLIISTEESVAFTPNDPHTVACACIEDGATLYVMKQR